MNDYISVFRQTLSECDVKSQEDFYDKLYNSLISVVTAQKLQQQTCGIDLLSKIEKMLLFIPSLPKKQQIKVFSQFLSLVDSLNPNYQAQLQLLLIPLKNYEFETEKELFLKRKLDNSWYLIFSNIPELKKMRGQLYSKYGVKLGSRFQECWSDTYNQVWLEVCKRYNPERGLFKNYFCLLFYRRFIDYKNQILGIKKSKKQGNTILVVTRPLEAPRYPNTEDDYGTLGDNLADPNTENETNYSTETAVKELLRNNPYGIFDTKYFTEKPELTFKTLALLMIQDNKTSKEISQKTGIILGTITSRFYRDWDYFLPFIQLSVDSKIALSSETQQKICDDIAVNFNKSKLKISQILFKDKKQVLANLRDILILQIGGLSWYELVQHLHQNHANLFTEKEFIIWYLDTIKLIALTDKTEATRQKKLAQKEYLFDYQVDFRLQS